MNIDDIREEREHCRALIKEHRKVQRVLELQSATWGLSTPPYILLGIESKQKEIQNLENRIIRLQTTSDIGTNLGQIEDFDQEILSKYEPDIKNVRRIFKLIRELFPSAYKQELASIDTTSLMLNTRLSGIWNGDWTSSDSPSEFGRIELIVYQIDNNLIGTASLSNSILSFFDD